MFAVFNWKMDQEVDSAFIVFDLVGGDAGFPRERDSRGFVHSKLDDRKESCGACLRRRESTGFRRGLVRRIRRVASYWTLTATASSNISGGHSGCLTISNPEISGRIAR
jgi:hypothetical protein